MTGPIAYARADLTEAIRAALPVDVTVYAAMPERLNPPCVVVVEGTPLLEGDDTPRGAAVTFEAVIVEAPSTAEHSLDRLDQHTDALLLGLWAEWEPKVTQYGHVTGPDSQPYLSSTITTITRLSL